jgi:hypothetical protein
MSHPVKALWSGGLAALGLTSLSLGLACGGGGSVLPSSNVTPQQTGNLNLTLSDASTEDWATIGVKVLSIALVPQGGGANVTVYTAPGTPPVVNLVQLDQLSEILGNIANVPAATYTGVVLTLSANPGDVTLVTAADPSAGFAGAAGTAIPSGQIQIQGATGVAGSKTIAVPVNFVSDLVVAANQSNALDVEFNLAHPAFIVEHEAAGDTAPSWAVSFKGTIRHHPARVENLILRHLYGTVASVSGDNTSITVTRDYPAWPPTSPETADASGSSVTILADAAHGTLFYNMDGTPLPPAAIQSFSALASTLPGEYARIATRYQPDGTLVATRIWASSTFNKVYVGPEGHVLHVDASATPPTFTVQNELGQGVPLQVGAGTQFFFRTPADAVADASPIATGPGFLTNGSLVRGFKVHTSVDPTTSPMTALTVDIEIARFDGAIAAASPDFTYTRAFATAADDYTKTLGLISPGTANGTDPLAGTAIAGYKWWDFSFPTQVFQDPAGTAFFDAVGGSVTFGGTAAAVQPWGVSYCAWNDPAAAAAWSAKFSILMPTELPKGTVGTAWAAPAGSSTDGSFGLNLPGGANTVTVDLDTASGSAALVYQVDRTSGILTVSPVDITTAAGQATLAGNLTANVPVRVWAVPQADGTLKGYVVFYFTGTLPTQ